jgi:hypothetical protein
MYSTLSPEKFRDWLKDNELSGAEAARIVGTDSRTIRRYTAPPDQPGARALPWAVWALLRLYVGELSVDQYREEVVLAAGNGE